MILETCALYAAWNGKTVLHNISLRACPGDFIALTGPNGSGKSTLLSVLAGIRPAGLTVSDRATGAVLGTDITAGPATDSATLGPVSGTDASTDSRARPAPAFMPPSLDGYRIDKMPRKQIARHIAYLSQSEVPAWNGSVRDSVLNGRYAHTNASGIYSKEDFAVTDYVMEQVQISHLAQKGVRELSGGEYQKVRIARALAQQPDFLLLDEPVAPLDFGYQMELMELLLALTQSAPVSGTITGPLSAPIKIPGILISIHDLNLAALFVKKMLLLPMGTEGTPAQILDPALLQTAYGTLFERYAHPRYGSPQVYVPRR